MYLKQRKASTDPSLRSLLQKAARRGYSQVVEVTARRLNAIGDGTWLRSRAVVVTFEECWPLAQHLTLNRDPESRVAALAHVTRAVKQKDAAGLGALSFAYHEGDTSAVDHVPNAWAVRVVSEALERPVQFFSWATSQAPTKTSVDVIEAARRYLAAATWGWDKACILAGAFLAATGEVPTCDDGQPPDCDFPYWVALDKHTPDGKEVLRQLGIELGVSYRHLIWAGFYFESATVNSLSASPWFEAERAWRLKRAGLSLASGAELWSRVRSILPQRLHEAAQTLRKNAESTNQGQQGLFEVGGTPLGRQRT